MSQQQESRFGGAIKRESISTFNTAQSFFHQNVKRLRRLQVSKVGKTRKKIGRNISKTFATENWFSRSINAARFSLSDRRHERNTLKGMNQFYRSSTSRFSLVSCVYITSTSRKIWTPVEAYSGDGQDFNFCAPPSPRDVSTSLSRKYSFSIISNCHGG